MVCLFTLSLDSYETMVQLTNSNDEIFELLYHINELTVQTVATSIISSNWVKTEEGVQELVAYILQVVRTSFLLQPFLIELIISLDQLADDSNYLKILIPFISNKIVYSFYKCPGYCSFALKMSSKGLVSINEVVNRICLIDSEFMASMQRSQLNDQTFGCFNQKSDHSRVVSWFFPELHEIKHFSYVYNVK